MSYANLYIIMSSGLLLCLFRSVATVRSTIIHASTGDLSNSTHASTGDLTYHLDGWIVAGHPLYPVYPSNEMVELYCLEWTVDIRFLVGPVAPSIQRSSIPEDDDDD